MVYFILEWYYILSNLVFHNEKDCNNVYMEPLKFVDILDTNKHIVLYYENEEFGRKIQYRFIRNGLKKGDTCIYTIHDDNISLIEDDMKNNGIEVEVNTKRGLLKIFKIPNIMEYPEGILRSAQEVW